MPTFRLDALVLLETRASNRNVTNFTDSTESKYFHCFSAVLIIFMYCLAVSDDLDVELRLARYEELMDKRPFLLSRSAGNVL